MKIITIKDIAQMVNVSPSTVSRALKDHPDIGAELKQKIQEIAKALKFTPNTNAANLRKQKSQLIGVIIPRFIRNFVPDVVDGIAMVVDDKQYQMIIIPTNDKLEKECDAIKKCCDYRVDGILLSVSTETKELSHLELAKEFNIPVVLLDKSIDDSDFHQVIIDDKSMAKQCAEYLLDLGKKNIAAFFGHENLRISQNRHSGFSSAINAKDVQVKSFFCNSTEEAYQQTISVLQNSKIDAFFGMSDQVLLGILAAIIHENKLKEVSIIGFSDGKTIPFLHPEVAYVLHHGKIIGAKAAELLFQLINGEENISKIVKLKSEIIHQSQK